MMSYYSQSTEFHKEFDFDEFLLNNSELDSSTNDSNLYIKNIDYDISDDALYNVFSYLGDITSHHIVRDCNKRSRGFGFLYVFFHLNVFVCILHFVYNFSMFSSCLISS